MSFKTPYPDKKIGEYCLTADKKKLDLHYVYQLMCTPSANSNGLPQERFPFVIQNSTCFSLLWRSQQVGFARVISDFTEFASIWDVFIDEPHRSKGLGRAMMAYLLEHPQLRGMFRWFLMTENAHGLYSKFGFRSEPYNPYVMMRVSST